MKNLVHLLLLLVCEWCVTTGSEKNSRGANSFRIWSILQLGNIWSILSLWILMSVAAYWLNQLQNLMRGSWRGSEKLNKSGWHKDILVTYLYMSKFIHFKTFSPVVFNQIEREMLKLLNNPQIRFFSNKINK